MKESSEWLSHRFDAICAARVKQKKPRKIRLLMPYPSFRVIDRASPPVSLSVVARILMIQNASVTLATLLRASVLAAVSL